MTQAMLDVPVHVFLLAAIVLGSGASGAEPMPFRRIIIDSDNPTYPHCKTVGDLDGDGCVDVLAASAYGQGLYWYAWPHWTKHRIAGGTFTTDMQVGDVDNDGDLDVIIPHASGPLVWFENPRPQGHPATASWRMHVLDKQGGHDVEVGDLYGNGKLDIVVRDTQGTRVFLQQAPNVWQRIDIPTGGRGGLMLADLDGDSDLDLVQNGYWHETPADPQSEWKRHEISAGWPDDCGVHAADLNDDGRLDVLLAPAEAKGRLSWFDAADPRKGPWIEHVIDDDVSHLHTFKTADMNHDGHLDVITAEMEQSPHRRVVIHFIEGNGRRWRRQVVGWTGSHNLRVADIGNDGDLDIIGANHGNYGGHTPVDLWENLTKKPAPTLPLDRWQRHVIDPQKPWGAAFVLAGDLDGDGLRDIVAGGSWYQNPGRVGQSW